MKEELAVFGGTPIRENPIYYGKQYIDEDDIQAVVDVLRDELITCGPKVDELEKKLSYITGAKYAVVLSNGTAALHIACLAANLKENDEVITTPMTFAASANCILYCGAKPIFADIEIDTYNISPSSIKECITEKTKAVIAVDFTGQAVKLDEIKEICNQNHLILIEDAAHSLGTKYKGKQIGGIADMTTFSFHPVKTVTGGEGGAVLTNSYDLYSKLILLRTHAITKDLGKMKYPNDEKWRYEQVALGYNYRITDFQAALILSQLNKLDLFIARRKKIVEMYNQAFAGVTELVLQKEISESDTARHLYIIQLKIERMRCTRKEFFNALIAENIIPNVHYIPVYYHPYYEELGYEKGLCPVAEVIYERIISIPLYYSMTDEDVETVLAAVKKVIKYYKK